MDLTEKADDLGCNLIITSTKDRYHYLCDIQKWLRKEHNIIVLISISDKPYLSFEHNVKTNSKNLFDTYEEALEEGLQEALKLIK